MLNPNDTKGFDVKELERIAKACRKAGIKVFKGFGMELTLTEDAPPPSAYIRQKSAKGPVADTSGDAIDTDGPTPEDLLFWSAPSTSETAE